ncbi:unnamed protein product [Effrenium voratum]|uniref:Uncharacterized protein n=1 Tax=Effrenium voratum TaxID=2562239 RepID=A0AA36IVR3_9DINO|nr:unnamed protein product [Effrenium voratum]
MADAELQIKHREQTCQQIQATVSQNKLELAHLELDLEWHQSALQGAEERRKELQNSQRKLLGTLHGKMYEISDVTGSPSAPSATMYPSSPGALHTPRRLEPMPPR